MSFLQTTEVILKEKIIGVIRSNNLSAAKSQLSCLYAAGLKVIEVSANNHEYAQIIDWAHSRFTDLTIGVATIMCEAQLQKASESAAQFFVSPVSDERMLQRAKDLGKLFIPGACSPSEVSNIINYHPEFPIIKLFPVASAVAFEGLVKVFCKSNFLLSSFPVEQTELLIQKGAKLFAVGSHFTEDLHQTAERVKRMRELLSASSGQVSASLGTERF